MMADRVQGFLSMYSYVHNIDNYVQMRLTLSNSRQDGGLTKADDSLLQPSQLEHLSFILHVASDSGRPWGLPVFAPRQTARTLDCLYGTNPRSRGKNSASGDQ